MNNNNSIHALAYFNLLKTGSWIDEKVKLALKPFNITHAQFNVLFILNNNDPNPVSANELKSKILVANPDVTRLLDRLVKKGHVLRMTCPENRRKIDISITQSGKDFFNEAESVLGEALGNFFINEISEEEARELRRILHKIRD